MRVTCIGITITVPFVASYGFFESIALLTAAMVVHAIADAMVMPASQLAVAEASGEDLAAGQGLFNATGLASGALVALGSGAIYGEKGALWLFLSVAALMTVSLCATLALAHRELLEPVTKSVVGRIRNET